MPSKSLNIAIGIPRRLAEGPLFRCEPIRQFWTLSRSSTVQTTHVAPVARRSAQGFKRCSVQQKIGRRSYQTIGGKRWTPNKSDNSGSLAVVLGASAIAVLASAASGWVNDTVQSNDVGSDINIDQPEETHDVYRLAEVVKHDEHSSSQWVIRGTAVYDITDFIEGHPGGKVIWRACGGSIDPYWKLFSIHNKPEVWEILDQYYIGEVDRKDLNADGTLNWSVLGPGSHTIEDPFKDDPERDASLIMHTPKPCNAETPSNLLADFLTPLHLFFVRNHLWTPRIEPQNHQLEIELSDGDEVVPYTIEDLKQKFKQHTVTVTLQCAGNRRDHMNKAANGKTSGLPWNVGAIGTADFTGVYLRDVLKDAGYDVSKACEACTSSDSEADRHIILASVDTYEQSIPLQSALNPASDVLLAWEMNGEPMPADHGGPLRAIVPGSVATRSIKWINKIRTSCDESGSNWHTRDYKCFGPNVRAADLKQADWDEAQAIHELPVQSAITNIARLNDAASPIAVQGFAYSGGGRKIVRVDVSADGGKTFRQAELRKDEAKGSRRWAWTLWDIEWPQDQLPTGLDKAEFVVKAVDDSHCTQPENFDGIWNFRGLLGNAWHRVSWKDADE